MFLFSQVGVVLLIAGGVIAGTGLLCIGIGFLSSWLYNRKHKKTEENIADETQK